MNWFEKSQLDKTTRQVPHRLRERIDRRARLAVSMALPVYRRLLPTKLRALIPQSVRRAAKWSLGIKDPIAQVHELRLRLNDLGFVERALAELDCMAESENAVERQLAAWELAVWHANDKSSEGYAAALASLDAGLDDIAHADLRRRESILRAECHAALGKIEAGRAIIAEALRETPHPDLRLAAANLHEDPGERIAHVNLALRLFDLSEVSLRPAQGEALYDRLMVSQSLSAAAGPKITVIVPAFNAANHITTALEALIAQTWQNFEALVVDDLSTDSTAQIVSAFSQRDPRIRLIRAEVNRGSYFARNIALSEASGEFVTTHDSDDWSHPQKLEVQARHLMCHPNAAANMSQQARATDDLAFHRRGNPGFYIFDNMSSLMFRRQPVLAKLGSWDSVRFGADSEFIERIRLAFGRTSVSSLTDAGPLSFQRQSESSLTASSAFGFHGFFMGARLAYHQASRRHHRAKRLFYEFPQAKRPFAVPEPMWPEREVAKDERRHFDVVLASDFRMPGGFGARNLACVEEERRQGRRVGLIQMARYDFDPTACIQSAFLDLEDEGEVHFVVVGERVSCERLAVLHPPVLETFQRFVPDVDGKNIQVIVDEVPPGLSTPEAVRGWMEACKENARRYFGSAGVWTFKDKNLSALRVGDQPEEASGRSET